jgi:hypothetical protein
MPGPLRAVVLREGARVAFCDLVGGGAVVPVDSAFFWPGLPDCVPLSFVMALTKLSRASKSILQRCQKKNSIN